MTPPLPPPPPPRPPVAVPAPLVRQPDPPLFPPALDAKRAEVEAAIDAGKTDREIVTSLGVDPDFVRYVRHTSAPHLGSIISRITRVDSITQLDWYVDPNTGSDTTGDGKAPSTALRSVAELVKRWGPAPYVDGIHVVVHLADYLDDETIDLDVGFARNGSLSFVGNLEAYREAPTPVVSFTMPVLSDATTAIAPIVTTDLSVVNAQSISGQLWEAGRDLGISDPRALKKRTWALGFIGNQYSTIPAGSSPIAPADINRSSIASRPMGAWFRPNPTGPGAFGRRAPVLASGGKGPPPPPEGFPVPQPGDPSLDTTWTRTACTGFNVGKVRARTRDQVGGTLQFVNLTTQGLAGFISADPLAKVEFWECNFQQPIRFREGTTYLVNCLQNRRLGWIIDAAARVEVWGGAFLARGCDVYGTIVLTFGALVINQISLHEGGRLILGNDVEYPVFQGHAYAGDYDASVGLLAGPYYLETRSAIHVDARASVRLGDGAFVYGPSSFELDPGSAIRVGGSWMGHVDLNAGAFRAFVAGTGSYTQPRALNVTTLDAPVNAGGFSGAAIDPKFGTVVARGGGYWEVDAGTADAFRIDTDSGGAHFVGPSVYLNSGQIADCFATVVARQDGVDAYYRAEIPQVVAHDLAGRPHGLGAATPPANVRGTLGVSAGWAFDNDYGILQLFLTGLDATLVHWDVTYSIRVR